MDTAAIRSAHSIPAAYLDAFERHLRAENKAPATITTYRKACDQLAAFLDARGMPELANLRREHIEAFLVDLQERAAAPATVAQRYRSIQQLFRWLVDEGEVHDSPMARMKVPAVPVVPPPVLGEDDLRKLLDACKGTDFEARRDTAIIRMLLDTGMRRAELAGLLVAQVEFDKRDGGAAIVMGKGRRPRACPFGVKTAASLDRYLFARARHQHADLEALWVGKRGILTANGILQMLRRRGHEAGVPHVYTHLFRHTYAHEMLADGMQEGDLMHLMGHRSTTLIHSLYGASAAVGRARIAYRKHSPGDKL
jgi:site-specific recombinase XerD